LSELGTRPSGLSASEAGLGLKRFRFNDIAREKRRSVFMRLLDNTTNPLVILLRAVMVPAVFLLNGSSKHNWVEAFLFALAVAVGLTPELLPMIVTVDLSKGAIAMARKKLIVKRLNAIQNFSAMHVLCIDKTGTITQGRIVLQRHLDVRGHDSERVLHYGYINSYYQTGLKNLMDEAIRDHGHLEEELQVKTGYRKIDEIPFDLVRRRISMIVEDNQNQHIRICKSAVEEVMRLSTRGDASGSKTGGGNSSKHKDMPVSESL
jgi:P-type Mg2+ transporter